MNDNKQAMALMPTFNFKQLAKAQNESIANTGGTLIFQVALR
jgi:hypothetical protein